MSVIVISTNLNQNSKTDILAKLATDKFNELGFDAEYLALASYDLPLCDGYECYSNESVIELQKKFAAADSFILCSPVYCYDLNAVAKNLIELTGASVKEKVFSFIVNAGAEKSYMAPMKFMNSLMIDFRCLILPKFLYVTSKDFDKQNKIDNQDIIDSLDSMVKSHLNLTKAYLSL